MGPDAAPDPKASVPSGAAHEGGTHSLPEDD